MGKGILLDKELGVNPTMTYCPRCGGEHRNLLLLGEQANLSVPTVDLKF